MSKPKLPEISLPLVLASDAFCLAGNDPKAVAKASGRTELQLEKARDAYNQLAYRTHDMKRKQVAELFKQIIKAGRADLGDGFDPANAIAGFEGGDDYFDAINQMQFDLWKNPHVGPFTGVDWVARYIYELGEKDNIGTFFSDGEQIFLYGSPIYGDKNRAPLEGVDAATFKILHRNFVADDKRVYALKQDKQYPVVDAVVPLKSADRGSFEVLNWHFAKDAKAVYFRDGKIISRDPENFELMPAPGAAQMSCILARDSKNEFIGKSAFPLRDTSYRDAARVGVVKPYSVQDGYEVFPPCYRISAILEEGAFDGEQRELTDLVLALQNQWTERFRMGRVVVAGGTFPRVKITAERHWKKLTDTLLDPEYETVIGEMFDGPEGQVADLPAFYVEAQTKPITLEFNLPVDWDWREADELIWSRLREIPMRFAVAGFGFAMPFKFADSHDECLYDLMQSREDYACALCQPADVMRTWLEDEDEIPAWWKGKAHDYIGVPDIGFKTLIGQRILSDGDFSAIGKLSGVEATEVAGNLEVVIGDRPIWGTPDEAKAPGPYQAVRKHFAARQPPIRKAQEKFAYAEAKARWLAAIDLYFKDWK